MTASKNLGVLSLDADFAYKCSSSTTGVPASTQTEAATTESAVGPTPPSLDTSKRSWPPHGTLTMEFITQQCPTLFNGTGYLGPPVDFDLNPNIKPTHAPVHHQPGSKLKEIKAALDTYEATSHLVRVSQPTECISNMIVRERAAILTKPGKMHVCLDPSQTLNKAICRPKHIIPTLEENLHKLHNVKYMTIIDVSDVSIKGISEHTTYSAILPHDYYATPWGRYRWTRLPFGISSASEEWQRRIHVVLDSLTVISIADDNLVPGCGETEKKARVDHDRNLITVLERVNATKMKFLTTSATFMGHVITPDGLRPDPTTVHAVIQLTTPRDKQGVRRFLGAINYLSKFCPRLSSVTQPLPTSTKMTYHFCGQPNARKHLTKAKP